MDLESTVQRQSVRGLGKLTLVGIVKAEFLKELVMVVGTTSKPWTANMERISVAYMCWIGWWWNRIFVGEHLKVKVKVNEKIVFVDRKNRI